MKSVASAEGLYSLHVHNGPLCATINSHDEKNPVMIDLYLPED